MRRPVALNIILPLFLILVTGNSATAQFTAKRIKTLQVIADTTVIDSLTIIPGTFEIMSELPAQHTYRVDTLKGLFLVENMQAFFDSRDTVEVKVSYRVFPYQFNRLWHPAYSQAEEGREFSVNRPFAVDEQEDFFDFGDLDKSGAISRGFSIGNKQDASLNSNLNLQLNGALTNDIMIRAAITDDNIPVQPEGNTQQIQDFDKVFIELQRGNAKLVAGDFEISKNEGPFLLYNRRAQGTKVESQFSPGNREDSKVFVSAGAALSRGKYARNKIEGQEGNQGPYRLRGNENERFIIILAGSEKVYLDGSLLKRGAGLDYVINYNTAEITFMPHNMISKDSRITVEFEYADRNYARALFAADAGYESKRLKIRLSYFNQSDLKNQPFEMELNDTIRSVLAGAGDDPGKAVISGVDSVRYSSDQIMYKMIDSLGYDSVLVYSTNPDSALYRVRFSKVGQNGGDYVKAQTAANGTVFKWVAPQGGMPQGEYAPVQLLIAPEKTELISLSTSYVISKSISSGFTATTSSNDQNLFSGLDSEDDRGYATEAWLEHKIKPGQLGDTGRTTIATRGAFKYIDRNFTGINRFRSVEFERNWNLDDRFDENEIQTSIASRFSNEETGFFEIKHHFLQREEKYQGNKFSLNGNFQWSRWFASFDGSLLNASMPATQSRFLRHKGRAGRKFKYFQILVREEAEHNTFTNPGDSLNSNSFAFQSIGAEVSLPDTSRYQSKIGVRQRVDFLPLSGDFVKTSLAREAYLSMQWKPGRQQQLESQFTFRKLDITDSLSPAKPEESINTRINYTGTFARGAIRSQSFYQNGSGLEVEKDFTYLEVSPGQGVYAWEDYNNNGIREIDEFEISNFQDQANYIRVYTPSDEYMQVHNNQFTQVLYLNPSRAWKNSDNRIKALFSKFSNRFTYRVTRKNQLDDFFRAYNPFFEPEDHSKVIGLNEQLKNVIYFQRSHPKFGANWSYRSSRNKTLLANGFEERRLEENLLNVRWNISSAFSLMSELSKGNKKRQSEFFRSKEYDIEQYVVEPVLSYQPSAKFRLRGIYSYSYKENSNAGGSDAFIREYGIEMRRTAVNKGNLNIRFTYLDIFFGGDENSSVAYEMLEGFMDGDNFRWSINYQREILDYLQLNLQYEGRKTPGAKAIHIGRIQLRAYF